MVKKVLFLCTGNSCRSQMAQGWCDHLHRDALAAESAGVAPHGIDSRAVTVMQEAGVDIRGQRSQHVDEFKDVSFDLVVTVCDNARESCPVLPGKHRVLHRAFDDPPRLAADLQGEDQKLEAYRRVRDEIRDFVETLPGVLAGDRT